MKENIRLVQLNHPLLGRKIALVREPSLILLSHVRSIYELALQAIDSNNTIVELVKEQLSENELPYAPVYEGENEWVLLPSFDCPESPFGCMVSGTGLTHKNSALNRQMMHAAEENSLTDSMKMYQWGLEGGQPAAGAIGWQPEWFYKGTGATLKAHGQPLEVPAYANDGGEEPEIAGIYVVDNDGQPYRVGFTTGNEFSDHVMERQNYLYLAPSKLRSCAIGPELVVGCDFKYIKGTVKVLRNKKEIWSSGIQTGEDNMAHSLQNLEYHHFKYEDHRLPLQAHVHFFGADAFSFGAGLSLQNGDEMFVHWEGMGRPLINKIKIDQTKPSLVAIKALDDTSA
ncbi:MAG: AraD1 family protein [Ferruginibacter sp.]